MAGEKCAILVKKRAAVWQVNERQKGERVAIWGESNVRSRRRRVPLSAVLDGDRVVADVRVDDALVARHQGEGVDEEFTRLGSAFVGPVFIELLQRFGH